MKISDKKVVALTYTLTVDGQVADQTTEDRPLDFIFGMGYLLPKFEENIAGSPSHPLKATASTTPSWWSSFPSTSSKWMARFRKVSSPSAT